MEDKEELSIEPEIATLSLIINYPDLLYSTEGLKNFMFEIPTHNNIFSIMQAIKDSNSKPDLAMVLNFARSLKKLEACGGEVYINHLKNQTYPRDNFAEFLKTVKNSHKLRTLVGLTSGVTIDTLKISNIDDSISRLQSNLERLLTDSAGEGTYSIGSLVKDSFNEIVDRVGNPGVRGYPTGIKSVDIMTGGYDGGDLWYIGARPGMGKTAYMLVSALSGSKAGIPSLVFSKEMSRQPIMDRFISIDTGIPLSEVRQGLLTESKVEAIRTATLGFMDLPLYIDLNFTGSLELIESTIRKYVSTSGVRVVYLDYIQLLSERNSDQTQELGRISRKLKLLANQLDITVVILSQLNREVEHRENKRPVAADLRQCGNLEEDADFIIGLYRDEVYFSDTKDKAKLEFIILKQRNGPTGMVKLGWDGVTTRIKED